MNDEWVFVLSAYSLETFAKNAAPSSGDHGGAAAVLPATVDDPRSTVISLQSAGLSPPLVHNKRAIFI